MSKLTQKSTYVCQQGKKKPLKDIDFDEDKLKKLFATQEKKKGHYDYDYYFDETDMENEVEQTNNEDSNDEVVIKKKDTATPPAKKQKKKQKGVMDFIKVNCI